jgi:hypothetical protein
MLCISTCHFTFDLPPPPQSRQQIIKVITEGLYIYRRKPDVFGAATAINFSSFRCSVHPRCRPCASPPTPDTRAEAMDEQKGSILPGRGITIITVTSAITISITIPSLSNGSSVINLSLGGDSLRDMIIPSRSGWISKNCISLDIGGNTGGLSDIAFHDFGRTPAYLTRPSET